MNKTDFLLELTERLSPLPWEEIEDRWAFYSEMIEDSVDEGLTEEEAVARLGPVEEIAAQILTDVPLSALVKARMKPKKRLGGWVILLLVLGSPVWLALLIAAFAVVCSVYVCLWAVVIVLWAAFAALICGGAGGVASGLFFGRTGSLPAGLAVMGGGLVCAGFAVFLFFGCRGATKGTARLAKKFAVWIKRCFIRKEGVQ